MDRRTRERRRTGAAFLLQGVYRRWAQSVAEYVGLTVRDGFRLIRGALLDLTAYAAEHFEVTIVGLLTVLVVWNFLVRLRA